MPIENLTNHTHNAGLGRHDWDFSTDQSVDLAAEKLRAGAHDGLSASEVLEYIKSGLDFGQLTDREARQISAALRWHYHQMSPEAKAIADKFEATLQPRVGTLHDCSDEVLSGYEHDWLISFRMTDPDKAVLEGDDLNAFVADLEGRALPPCQYVLSADLKVQGLMPSLQLRG
jgi:hypothetical protein